MNKKIIVLVILICTLVVGIGVSLAYFAVNNQNDGNETNLNITTERLGSILWTGTKVFTSYDLLPGQIGVQEFTIEKNSEQGTGIYEIDLAGVLPSEFGTDIEISLYKTTDPISNNITVDVADPTLENQQIYQEDSLNITGTPELVYQGTLANNSQIILEQADFDVSTLEKTTYYLVYHYKNNGNQDNQQGLTFSGTISVRIINAKSSYCELHPETGACSILALGENDELKFDGTIDNNLRYIGADPDNYVSFNNELWRIIGVMNNIDDGTGKRETRLKIIRNEPIGQYSWDNKPSGIGTSKSSHGSNDWSDSNLQLLLNEGAYWNRTTGDCPTGENGVTTPCDFTKIGFTDEAKAMIDNAVWNLGGPITYNDSDDGLTSHWYSYERGTQTYEARPITWVGQIGLMYPSDYGYATSGGGTTDRTTCLETSIYRWSSLEYVASDCYINDWLYGDLNYQWTITPHASYTEYGFVVSNLGHVGSDIVSPNHDVSPTVYLSTNVRIVGGTGTSLDPFELSL